MGGMSVQRSIRFPDELDERLGQLAKADGRTFSQFVVRTLEKALREPGPVEAAPGAQGQRRDMALPGTSTPPRAPVEKEPSEANIAKAAGVPTEKRPDPSRPASELREGWNPAKRLR